MVTTNTCLFSLLVGAKHGKTAHKKAAGNFCFHGVSSFFFFLFIHITLFLQVWFGTIVDFCDDQVMHGPGCFCAHRFVFTTAHNDWTEVWAGALPHVNLEATVVACGWLQLVHRHDDSKMLEYNFFSSNEVLLVNVLHQLKTLFTS